jgi:ferredoxin
MGDLVYLKNVVTLTLNAEACAGCGTCLSVCRHAVLEVNLRHAEIVARDRCMECSACAVNCPTGAITVQSGVGCATAVINSALGRQGSDCCCLEPPLGGE